MSHSKGPWENEYFDRVDSADGIIAWLNKGVKGGKGDCAGNCRLIAAAPELLNVCVMALSAIRKDAVELRAIKQTADPNIYLPPTLIEQMIPILHDVIQKAKGSNLEDVLLEDD